VNHKWAVRPLSRGTADGAQTGRPQAGFGHAHTDAGTVPAERSVSAGLRLRSAGQRATIPHSGDLRRVHAALPGRDRRLLAVGQEGGALTRPADRCPRQAQGHRQRQRHGADQQRHPGLDRPDRRRLALIAPGRPGQNAFIESFHDRLREEFLNEMLFISLAQARIALEEWRRDYNTVRPHSRIG
jgi:transposase InsO family protein